MKRSTLLNDVGSETRTLTSAPEIPLPPSNRGADFEEVASMLEDAETKEHVLQAYKTCFSTLMHKLDEYCDNMVSISALEHSLERNQAV